jgi:hypothetical protein
MPLLGQGFLRHFQTPLASGPELLWIIKLALRATVPRHGV